MPSESSHSDGAHPKSNSDAAHQHTKAPAPRFVSVNALAGHVRQPGFGSADSSTKGKVRRVKPCDTPSVYLRPCSGGENTGSGGRVARLSSAKAATAVRIRSRPQRKSPACAGLFSCHRGCAHSHTWPNAERMMRTSPTPTRPSESTSATQSEARSKTQLPLSIVAPEAKFDAPG